MPSKRLITDPDRYKTVLCTTWINTGSCPYGLKCRFAHGKEELRNRPPTCGQASPPQAEAAPVRMVPPSMALPLAMPVASSSSHSLGAPMPQAPSAWPVPHAQPAAAAASGRPAASASGSAPAAAVEDEPVADPRIAHGWLALVAELAPRLIARIAPRIIARLTARLAPRIAPPNAPPWPAAAL